MPFCSPASSLCLSLAADSQYDCRTSCTGLYADVTQEIEDTNDEKLAKGGNNINTTNVSALVKMWGPLKTELGDLLQSKLSSETLNMINKYKNYKNNYAKNMIFDPTVPELSMSLCKESKY